MRRGDSEDNNNNNKSTSRLKHKMMKISNRLTRNKELMIMISKITIVVAVKTT